MYTLYRLNATSCRSNPGMLKTLSATDHRNCGLRGGDRGARMRRLICCPIRRTAPALEAIETSANNRNLVAGRPIYNENCVRAGGLCRLRCLGRAGSKKIHKRIVTLILDIARNPLIKASVSRNLSSTNCEAMVQRHPSRASAGLQGGSGYLDHLSRKHHTGDYNLAPPAGSARRLPGVLKHLHRLWGFTARLEAVDEDGKVELVGECPARR